MTEVRANLFYEREEWKTPLLLSVAFHFGLVLAMFALNFVMAPRANSNWGENQGEAVTANLVSSASIPIPQPAEPTKNNIVANENKGVTETQPQPKEVETDDGISIKGKVPPKKIDKPVTPTHTPPRAVPTPVETAVPYGERGPVTGPFGNFTTTSTKGGFSFQNADFGSRFSWYVQTVNRVVTNNWYQVEVDQRVTEAKRVYLWFDIDRSGHPSNIRFEQHSDVPSLDQSAMRALQRIDTFGPLPPEYRGDKVSVEFWFDYHR
jgi:periplasmic protein TonB